MIPSAARALPISLAIAERHALREEVRDALIAAIVGGDFPPGERIVESRIARHLN